MGTNGPAAMFVWIDQRGQGHRAFDGGIESDTQFAHEVEVWAEAGRYDQLIDNDMATAAGRSGSDMEPFVFKAQACCPESRLDLNKAYRDQ